MAKSDAVWGIDIGQCSVKALRCRPHEKPDRITADAFDYIEYPQVLSAPGVDPTELISDAMQQLLARNSFKGDRVAISVAGQNGLAKFIKLPPVEVAKIPDIVRFEARQQIPFDLKKEVVWDFQRLEGGAEEEGFVLEAQIGLFAMKRDQVYKALEPFTKAGIEVDIVQLSPLSLYNFVRFDQLHELVTTQYDPEHPPPSVAILSVGTESTDLVITDGCHIWQRSIPIGGNHFTKTLVKELRLTFPKAEHLKRNATSAQDPKAVFQAMRPVFNEFLTEVQRSIGFFGTLERTASIESILALGNAVKLPGLRKFLEQNLGMPVNKVDAFRGLVGSSVVSAPAFQENIGSFGVCYGLALQALQVSSLHTNLIPREVIVERLIRAKRPWAVAAAAILLVGLAVSFASFSHALSTVSADEAVFGGPRGNGAEGQAVRVINKAIREPDGYKPQADRATKDFEATDQSGQHLVSNIEGRILWLELLKALNQCLPKEKEPDPSKWPGIEHREQLHLSSLDCVWVDDLATWFSGVSHWYEPLGAGEKTAAADNPAPPAEAAPQQNSGAPAVEGPKGPGWVIQLKGKHYHNADQAGRNLGAAYLRDTLIAAILSDKPNVKVPTSSGKDEWLTMRDLGVSYPVIVNPGPIHPVTLNNPNVRPGETSEEVVPSVSAREFPFVVQMAWQPAPPSKRLEKKVPAESGTNPPPAAQ